MKIPRGSGVKDRIALLIHEYYQHGWFRVIIGPVLLAVPPGVITSFYGFNSFHEAVKSRLLPVSDFLDQYVLMVVIFSLMYPIFLLSAARWVLHRVHSKTLTVDWLNTLDAALEKVVGCKSKRFSSVALDLDGITKEIAFCEITRPQVQIAELVRGVSEFFNSVRLQGGGSSAQLIRVCLAVTEDNMVVDLPIFYPEDEQIPLHAIPGLNHPNSAVKSAISSKKIIVIQSIKKELAKPEKSRRFVDMGFEEDNFGSIICYPVVYKPTGEVPFVISIHCDEEDYFKEASSNLYKCSLDRFALRMNLEYSLLLMKEALCD